MAGLLGCGPADDGRPEPSPSVDSLAEEAAAIRAAYIEASAQPVCTPRETSACRWYYYGEDGQLHCPMSIRICASTGRWLPCGEYLLGADGEPERPRRR